MEACNIADALTSQAGTECLLDRVAHLHPAVVDVAAPVKRYIADVLCQAELRYTLSYQLRRALQAHANIE